MKNNILEKTSLVVMILIATIGILLGQNNPNPQPLVGGNFNPSGGGTYRLQSSISSSQSSITLTSFKEPVSNIPYTMTYLNSSIEYGTIEPQSTNKEFISFTGITQNGDGTATLTGVSRGLSFSYPYTASSTLQLSHSGQTVFILSNAPQVYTSYASKSNDETITGAWAVPTPIPSALTQIANVAYVNAVAVSGAATSSESTGGLVQLATKLQQASSTNLGANIPLVLQAQYATSTYNASGSLETVITRNNNFIDPNFLTFPSTDIWSQAASTTFSGRFLSNATTTIKASSATSNALILNSVNYGFPSSQGASSTVLMNDGSGNLKWQNPGWQLLYASTTATTVATTTFSIAARESLKIFLNLPAITLPCVITAQFNADTGNNYAADTFANYTEKYTAGTTNNAYFANSGGTSSVTCMTVIDITNNASSYKAGFFNTIVEAGVGSGGFAWKNSSAQITSISIGGRGGVLPAGTVIRIYGSAE